VAGRQRRELFPPTDVEGTGAEQDRTNALLRRGCEGRFEIGIGSGIYNDELQAQRARFCVAKLIGDYSFLSENEGINGDFRSARSCDLLTPRGIDKADPIVPPIIRRKIGLQRRFYQLNVDDEILNSFLKAIPDAGLLQLPCDSSTGALREFAKMMGPLHSSLAHKWTTHFPAANLSRFLAAILDRHGEKVDLREGPGEDGADLVIELNNEFLERPIVIGVQVKCCEGLVDASTVKDKLDQLLRGWEANTLDYGALVLSGEWTDDAQKMLSGHNQNNPQRKIKKIDGTQLARIVTQLTWMENP
jgi:hypothetical protein